MVELKGYSAITISAGHAKLKKFDYQLTPAHCKPISTCCRHPCTIYIYTPPAQAWMCTTVQDFVVGQYGTFKTGADPRLLLETFFLSQEGAIFVATGVKSGRHTYTKSGMVLLHQQYKHITACLQPNGDLVWSHGVTSRLLSCSRAGPNIVQFRVSDCSCGDRLDDNNYWLQKDGLSRDKLPTSLEAAGLTLSDWQTFLIEINCETETRCSLGTCCFLSCVCTPVAGFFYCFMQGDQVLKRYLAICRTYEGKWKSHGIQVRLTTFQSYVQVPGTGYATGLSMADVEESRGVFVFQVICPSGQTQ